MVFLMSDWFKELHWHYTGQSPFNSPLLHDLNTKLRASSLNENPVVLKFLGLHQTCSDFIILFPFSLSSGKHCCQWWWWGRGFSDISQEKANELQRQCKFINAYSHIMTVRVYWNVKGNLAFLYWQNSIARPSNSPTVHDSKVTSRADSVADRKPYGQWVPISRSSSKKNAEIQQWCKKTVYSVNSLCRDHLWWGGWLGDTWIHHKCFLSDIKWVLWKARGYQTGGK